ncbi:MAG: hypothetical protein GWN81_09730, partial [Phycisphaerae bacterium]|nr:hypothetical protein [Phycisphaerae bacterium]
MAKRRIISRRYHGLHPHSVRGFTVIELIVIIAIVAVLAIITALNLSDWKANVYLKTAAR